MGERRERDLYGRDVCEQDWHGRGWYGRDVCEQDWHGRDRVGCGQEWEPPGPGHRDGQGLLGRLVELALPQECAGCALPGTGWCPRCAAVLRDGPVPVGPRVAPGVPVFSGGPFTGARRGAVIALKERGRRDLSAPLAAAVARMVAALVEAGEVDPPALAPLVLVPAASRRSAARRRGGDPVAGIAARSAALLARGAPPGAARSAGMLRLRRGVRDSVGLGVAERERNLAGRVAVRPPRRPLPAGAEVLLLDDVVTTGTTLAESVRALAQGGVRVRAALTVAHA